MCSGASVCTKTTAVLRCTSYSGSIQCGARGWEGLSKHENSLMINVDRSFFLSLWLLFCGRGCLLSHPDLPEEAAQVLLLLQQLHGGLVQPPAVLLPRLLRHAAGCVQESIFSVRHTSSGLVMSEYGRFYSAVNSPRRLDRVLFCDTDSHEALRDILAR